MVGNGNATLIERESVFMTSQRDIHPEIEAYWKAKGYEIRYWDGVRIRYYEACKDGWHTTIAIMPDNSPVIYYLGHLVAIDRPLKACTEKEMLCLVRNRAFL